jgi:hypothetical protein
VHDPRRSEEPLIKAFRQWILEEVAKTGVPESIASATLAKRRSARRRMRHGTGPQPDEEML